MNSPHTIPGLVSVSFRPHQPPEIVAATVTAGLQAIEWGGDVHVPAGDHARARTVGALTREHGLIVAAYGSYYYAGQGSDFAPVLQTALALGAPCIRLWAGRKGSASATAEERTRIVADLRRCAELAAAAGVRVATEFHADTLMDSAASARAALSEASHPALRTYWQPIHGETTDRALTGLQSLAPWLEHIHVFHWWPTLAERHPLAQGADRWRAFLQVAAAAPGPRCALLEFMPGNSLVELPAEAETLRGLLY